MLRTLTAAAALTASLFAASAVSPPAASADRCNPDEFVQMVDPNYQPVFGADDGPVCYVMKEAVYPAVGCDPAGQSLPMCVTAQPGRALSLTRGTCYELDEYKREQLGYHPATLPIPCQLLPAASGG